MRRILILVVIPLLLCGGGVGAAYFLKVWPFEPVDLAAGDSVYGTTSEQRAAEQEAEPEEDFDYLDLDPLAIPVFENGSVSSHVQIAAKLELFPGNLQEVSRYMPKITDALVSDLFRYLPYVMANGKELDVLALKGRMARVIHSVMPPGQFNDVLIQAVSEIPSQ